MDYIYELLTEEEYDYIWNYIYKNLNFNPSVKKSVVPFEINKHHTIYDISRVKDDEIDNLEVLIPQAFLSCIQKNEFIYALDWQHSGFKYNPRKKLPRDNEKILWVEDSRYFGGGYNAYFPSFYPDGDYYFL